MLRSYGTQSEEVQALAGMVISQACTVKRYRNSHRKKRNQRRDTGKVNAYLTCHKNFGSICSKFLWQDFRG